MPHAIFEQPDGELREVEVPEGWSLMEAARRWMAYGCVFPPNN